jgi:hypothetical protein
MLAVPDERVSMRVALVIGFIVTLGLWLYTGYVFQVQMETVRRDASDVAARYMRAQELLSTVRAQVLLSSVCVRDALLTPQRAVQTDYDQQLNASYHIITMALADYEPVMPSGAEGAQVARLWREVDAFHQTSLRALADAAGGSPNKVGEVLTRSLGPRREAAVAISEEIQALNRRAYIQQREALADIHRAAELDSRRGLGIALVISLGILLLTSVNSGRLEARLRSQLRRDARISRELYETANKLIIAQEQERILARELRDARAPD